MVFWRLILQAKTALGKFPEILFLVVASPSHILQERRKEEKEEKEEEEEEEEGKEDKRREKQKRRSVKQIDEREWSRYHKTTAQYSR